jgi:hypothetical protein
MKERANMYRYAGYALATTLLLGSFFYSLNSALSMPDVHFSYSTGECVEVINYTDEVFACDNYPKKYNHVWVE